MDVSLNVSFASTQFSENHEEDIQISPEKLQELRYYSYLFFGTGGDEVLKNALKTKELYDQFAQCVEQKKLSFAFKKADAKSFFETLRKKYSNIEFDISKLDSSRIDDSQGYVMTHLIDQQDKPELLSFKLNNDNNEKPNFIDNKYIISSFSFTKRNHEKIIVNIDDYDAKKENNKNDLSKQLFKTLGNKDGAEFFLLTLRLIYDNIFRSKYIEMISLANFNKIISGLQSELEQVKNQQEEEEKVDLSSQQKEETNNITEEKEINEEEIDNNSQVGINLLVSRQSTLEFCAEQEEQKKYTATQIIFMSLLIVILLPIVLLSVLFDVIKNATKGSAKKDNQAENENVEGVSQNSFHFSFISLLVNFVKNITTINVRDNNQVQSALDTQNFSDNQDSQFQEFKMSLRVNSKSCHTKSLASCK